MQTYIAIGDKTKQIASQCKDQVDIYIISCKYGPHEVHVFGYENE